MGAGEARRVRMHADGVSESLSSRAGRVRCAALTPLVAQLGESVAQHLQPQVGAREDALRVELHGGHRQRDVLHGHDGAVRLVRLEVVRC